MRCEGRQWITKLKVEGLAKEGRENHFRSPVFYVAPRVLPGDMHVVGGIHPNRSRVGAQGGRALGFTQRHVPHPARGHAAEPPAEDGGGEATERRESARPCKAPRIAQRTEVPGAMQLLTVMGGMWSAEEQQREEEALHKAAADAPVSHEQDRVSRPAPALRHHLRK